VVGKRLGEVVLDFAGDTDLHELADRGAAPVMLSLGVAGGDPQTLYFSFFRQGGGVIALGSTDPAEEARLQKHVLALHADMTDLTRELHKRNAELHELSRLKDQFIGMAAHDLRKPLGLILTTSEMLLMECEALFNQEQRALVQEMIRATQHMSELISGFLNVAVIESGKLELTLTSVAASDLLARAARMVAPYAKLQGVHIRLENALGDALVEVDASKIEQVLINLLSNAVDHAPANSEVIAAAGLIDDAPAFWVKDHGPGIAPEIRDRLFTPFVKGPTVRATRDRSIGLGLVISRKIVEAHHGRIYAESEPGHGATFYFVLPGRPMAKQAIVDQNGCL
jgi:signal transduction histidine kinase